MITEYNLDPELIQEMDRQRNFWFQRITQNDVELGSAAKRIKALEEECDRAHEMHGTKCTELLEMRRVNALLRAQLSRCQDPKHPVYEGRQ